jgi:protein kinase C substrate 80K-H
MATVEKFYRDTTMFTCISHPAVQIPFSAVNDDFCDCPDGSDEPGTSACAHLSPRSPLTAADRPGSSELELSAALPGFYCKNKGHRASYVPFQRVNDGVCDYELCCDGSDEWARVGGTKCEDRCKEIGKEWRRQEEQRQRSMTTALKKKRAMLVDAGRQQKEAEDHIRELEMQLEATELQVQEINTRLEEGLEDARKQESKVVRGKKTGKVNVLTELAKGRVEELRTALVEVRAERDETRAKVQELEDILSKFKAEYNPNFNDEGVKRAVRGWEEYAAREQGHGANADREGDLDELAKADSEASGIDWGHWENEVDGSEFGASKYCFRFLRLALTSTSLQACGLPAPVSCFRDRGQGTLHQRLPGKTQHPAPAR